MEIPAYISPSLCIGRTFDAETSQVGSDIFPPYIPTKTVDVNKYSFKYKLIKTNKDVRDLLDLSSELSLLIKANLLTATGTGQYINESRPLEGVTEVLAVIKCNTVSTKSHHVRAAQSLRYKPAKSSFILFPLVEDREAKMDGKY